MKPHILLDCDGPLSDFTGSFLDLMRSELIHCLPRTISVPVFTHQDVTRYEIDECEFFKMAEELAEQAMGEPYKFKKIIFNAVSNPGFCKHIKPQPLALEWVPKLRQWGEIYAVTAPWNSSPTWMYERLHWLKKYFDINPSHVIQTHAKDLIAGHIFVDDKPSHVMSWAKRWPANSKTHPVLFDMHHNKNQDEAVECYRGDWLTIAKIAEKLHWDNEE